MTTKLVSSLTIGVVLVGAACTREPSYPRTWQRGHIITINGFGSTVCDFEHEGHHYLATYNGGLLHSQSCTNTACQPMDLNKLRYTYYFTNNNHLVPADDYHAISTPLAISNTYTHISTYTMP